jgi:hypothetical protein
MCIVVGPRIDLAIAFIEMMKKIQKRVLDCLHTWSCINTNFRFDVMSMQPDEVQVRIKIHAYDICSI